jgi:DNA-binding NtrC family response regulator
MTIEKTESRNQKVIVVDDEIDIVDFLKSEIEEYDENIEVICYNNGLDAFYHIQQNNCNLLITDIAMPDMDGFELYSRVSELRPNLPIIMMTGFGYDPNHTVVNAKKAGLKDVIFKPFDMNKLMALIYQRIIK